MSANNDDNRNMVFEATLHIYNVMKGNNMDDLKKYLGNFKNEYYAEKGKQFGEFYLHFYKKMRCKDALSYLKNSPNPYTSVEMISHKKEVGTLVVDPKMNQAEAKKKERKANVEVDEEGFTIVKKK